MKSGFSLVELSIVLVILGLLTGGILSGQSLIRAAELRSVTSDYQRYTSAVNSFRDRYFALPGDMANATNFWGIAGGTTGKGSACYDVASTDARTCNGNSNGRLMQNDNVGDLSAPEWFRSWQHLANAGLVEGSFTGTKTKADREATPGVNVPAARFNDGGYTFMSFDGPTAGWWAGKFDGFMFGRFSAGVETRSGIVRPDEGWNIDTKLDDGRPAYGLIRTSRGQGSCNTSSTATEAEYAVTADTTCSLFLSLWDPGDS